MTYYDRLNAFFLANEIDPLPASAQLLYLHLLHENNRLQNPGQFRLSESRLAAMTGLSRQTISTAKRTLIRRGLLNVNVPKSNPRAGTVYILPDGAESTTLSEELKKAWKVNNDGIAPSATEIFYLADEVKLHGEEAVKQAINRAGQKKRGRLSITFFKMILSDKVNGEAKRDVKGYEFGVDEAPES